MRRLAISCAVIALACSAGAFAQSNVELRRPGASRPALPDFAPPEVVEGRVLPPLAVPRDQDTARTAAGGRLRIDAYRFTGNTVITDRELERIAAPYTGREVSHEDLEALRDRLTNAYVTRGYVSSGALIAPQRVRDATVTIQIVEGTLDGIEVRSDGRFRPEYFRERIAIAAGPVVNVQSLERAIQVLERDDRVRRLTAALAPGEQRGRARLDVEVEENPPHRFSATTANDLSPTVGAQSLNVLYAHDNVSGRGDRFALGLTASRGFGEVDARYGAPINVHDTTLALRVRRSESRVIEDALRRLEIKSKVTHLGLELRHPWLRERNDTVELFAAGEFRQSESLLLGERFSFSPGVRNGVARVAVLRLGAEWTHRTRRQVLALRGTFNVGLDLFGATRNPGGLPDGRFLSWLGQAQVARRLPWPDAQIIARLDAQLSADPLLGLEQFAYGGAATVRGYRENERVSDNALVGGLELRIPLPAPWPALGRFELAPFLDVGHGWNEDRASSAPHTLASTGLGLLWHKDRASGTVYWGIPLRSVDRFGEHDLQDAGVHMRVTMNW